MCQRNSTSYVTITAVQRQNHHRHSRSLTQTNQQTFSMAVRIKNSILYVDYTCAKIIAQSLFPFNYLFLVEFPELSSDSSTDNNVADIFQLKKSITAAATDSASVLKTYSTANQPKGLCSCHSHIKFLFKFISTEQQIQVYQMEIYCQCLQIKCLQTYQI